MGVANLSSAYCPPSDTPSTWDEAKKYCEKSSSTLTSILTQQEYAFLASLMKKLDNVPEVWIGLQVLGEEKSVSQWVHIYGRSRDHVTLIDGRTRAMGGPMARLDHQMEDVSDR